MRKISIALTLFFLFQSEVFAAKQVFVGGDSSNPSATAVRYNALQGPFAAWVTDIDDVESITPSAGTASNFRIKVDTTPTGAETWTFDLLLDGAATDLSIVISAGETTELDTSSVSVSAGQEIVIRSTPSGTPDLTSIQWALDFEPTTTDYFWILGGSDGTNAQTNRTIPLGGHEIPDGSALDVEIVTPVSGTFRNLYISLETAVAASETWTFTLRKAGVATALTVTITEGLTEGSDTSNTVTAAAGERWGIYTETVAVGGVGPPQCGIVFDPDTAGQFLIPMMDDSSLALGTTFNAPSGIGLAWTATETSWDQLANAFTAKMIYCSMTVAPTAGNSHILTLRTNMTTDTALAVTVNDTETSDSVTTDVSISAADLLTLQHTVSGTPASSVENRITLVGIVPAVGGGPKKGAVMVVN